MRSALCRLRLRRQAHGVRVALVPGLGRATRIAAVAGGVLAFARIARTLFGLVRIFRS